MKSVQTDKKKNAKNALRAAPVSQPRQQQQQQQQAMTQQPIEQAKDKDVVGALRLVLADTFVLYMKTYAVHWNYQGPKFFSVHKMTEEQYQQLAEAIDTIAERIRALDQVAPISLEKILANSDLEEMSRVDANNDQALLNLISSHSLLARRAHEASTICADADDVFSEDMMIQRVGEHDKAAWMLRSFLELKPKNNKNEMT
jgi:starvation-inducible DNA-binding protein